MGQPEDAYIRTGRQLAERLSPDALAAIDAAVQQVVDDCAAALLGVDDLDTIDDHERVIARTRITAGAIVLSLLGAHARRLDIEGHDAGLTWDRVGAARGVTGDAVRQRARGRKPQTPPPGQPPR